VREGRSAGFASVSVPDGYVRYMLPQLFEPWAVDLVSRVVLRPGQSVLDVACGLGPVARLAASAAGPAGRVVACDISAAMLAAAAARPVEAGCAPVEYLECSASALDVADSTFDVVLCQQGLQFFPGRAAAVAEMARAVRPDGLVAVSTWAAEHPLGLFGPMCEVMARAGIDEPYRGAYDPGSYANSAADLLDLLEEAGLRDARLEVATVDAIWTSTDEAVSALLGTPFGPLVSRLPPDRQHRVRATLAEHLQPSGHGTVTVRTVSNTAFAHKQGPERASR
jgi:ubiquinone/menaquinone biosynthesis C-methylase UbiE